MPRQSPDSTHDEGVRGETTIEPLAGLRPAFDKQGHITAGNASQISDGASAMVITTAAVAERLGVTPLAEIISYGHVAGPDASLLHQPSRAIRSALERGGLSVGDVDLFEINEAFAAVGVASADDLGISMDIVNVNGGAIALAIRSACPATGSRCTSRSNSPDVAEASELQPCAGAGARVTPSCCVSTPDDPDGARLPRHPPRPPFGNTAASNDRASFAATGG